MLARLLPCLALALASPAPGLTLHLDVAVPEQTPTDAPVYVAGDFQGWNPGSPAHRLVRGADGRYSIDLTLPPGRIEFKFTRGSWSTVEKGPEGQEIGDRVLQLTQDATHELTVARWADLGPPRTLTGDVTEHTVPGLLDGRRVWVYRPPGYASETRSYPLLLMLDGQNVFDRSTSFAGEWRVDETCEQLVAEGRIEPLVVVAVDNGQSARLDEYTPWPDPTRGGGGGDAHLQVLIDALLPWVRANYRVLEGPQHTGFSGSSLGGLMSVHAALTRPEVFGRVGALSPSIWWNGRAIVDLARSTPAPAGSRLWVDMGGAESASALDDLRALCAALGERGWVVPSTLRCVEDPAAGHNEAAWAARLPEVLQFLFPPRTGVPGAGLSVGGVKGSYR